MEARAGTEEASEEGRLTCHVRLEGTGRWLDLSSQLSPKFATRSGVSRSTTSTGLRAPANLIADLRSGCRRQTRSVGRRVLGGEESGCWLWFFQLHVLFGEEGGAEGVAGLELVEGTVEGALDGHLQQGEMASPG